MSVLLRSFLVLGLCVSISCSRGGAGDDTGNGNGGVNKPGGGPNQNQPGGQNQTGGIAGQWSDGVNTLTITNDSLTFVGKCQDGRDINLQTKISIKGNAIVFQENKQSGCLAVTNGQTMQYTLNGDNLSVDTGQGVLGFQRVGGGNQGDNGNNQGGGAGTFTIDLFTGPNCTGQKMTYTAGMNCAQLNGNISSFDGGDGCKNTKEVMTAQSICQSINQQVGGQ